jgi:hypothetical protein
MLSYRVQMKDHGLISHMNAEFRGPTGAHRTRPRQDHSGGAPVRPVPELPGDASRVRC